MTNPNVATATTPAPPVLPLSPTNLVASAISSTQIALGWRDASADENNFFIERSLDGSTNWTQVGTVGANVTTFTDSTGLSASTQYFYRVRSSNAAGSSTPSNSASATTLAASTNLPSPWTDSDIGAVGSAGSGALSGGVYTVKGAGADIWNAADAFNFAYIPLNGDGSITAQVTSLANTEQWAKAGVMIRESLAAGATEASVVVTPSNGSVFLFRTATGGTSDGDFTDTGLAPYWVRLTRSGSTFTASISPDGITWSTLGTQTISMASNVFIGLAVASRVTAATTGTFANVSITGTAPGTPGPIAIAPVSGTQINLSWADVNGETGFKVERSTDGVNFAQVGATLAQGVTTYSDATVFGSTLYYYRVRATNATGDSAPSAVVSSQTLQPPAAPTNLAGAPVANSLQVNLTWTDNATTETGFIVERSLDGSTNWTQIGTPAANATSFSDPGTGLTAGTTYFYRVRAVNGIGGSTNSNVANVTTTPAPTAPSNLVATPSTTALQIALAWTDNSSNESGFIIERSLDGSTNWTQIATPATNATAYTDSTGLSVSTTYYYRIRATNTVLGPSLNSAVASATSASPPAAPTNLVATPATNALQISLTWTDNSSIEDGFIVERSLDGATNWTQVGTPAINATSFTDSTAGLTLGTKFYYRVRATNSVLGASTNSNVANATTANVPAAPSNLVATPATTSLTINLTWTDNSSNEDGFIVERSPTGTGAWAQVGSTLAANATSFSDTTAGLTVNTAFFYRVRATDSVLGASANSNVATATTANTPAAPSNLIATAPANAVQINLTWTDNASNEDNFIVERSPDGSTNWAQVGAPAANATSFSDTSVSLAMNTTYYYRVRAASAALGASANSNVANATTAALPAAPTTLVATPAANALQISLTWTDNSNNETGFIVERSLDGSTNWTQVGTPAVNATSFTDSTAGLTLGTQFYYRVRAVDALGPSTNSNVANATTANVPAAPSNLAATASTSAIQINLTWTDNSSNEDGFVIERSPNGADTWTAVGTVAANATSFSDTTSGLTANTTFYYRVHATDSVLGSSSLSNLANAKTAAPPAAPSNLLATASTNSLQISLTWTDNSTTEDGFLVERSPDGSTNWTQVGTPAINATSFTDSSASLAVGTTYYYRVRATNAAIGASANSNVANATTASAPAAPSNLVATASASALQINLTWTDNSSIEDGYIVEPPPTGTGSWTQVGSTLPANTTAFSDTTSGLVINGTYYYRVRATNSILGASANSNVASATIVAAPAAPSNLVATASTSTLQVNLTWTDNSSNEDGFLIERSPDGTTNWTQVGAPAANATSFSDTSASLAVGTTYYYRVRATSNTLGASANSNVATATTASAPAAPTLLAATPESTVLQIDLTWTDNSNNETSFTVERSADGLTGWTQIGALGTDANRFSDTSASLVANTTYYYRVRAVNTVLGSSAYSNVASATTAPAPTAPSNLAAMPSTTAIEIDLSWTDNSNNESGFSIERSPDGSTGWTAIGTVAANTTTYADTSASLATNTQYYYRVRATNTAAGASAYSNTANAMTTGMPAAPSNLVATASPTIVQISLTWTDNSNNENGFVIERSSNGNNGWSPVGIAAANATSFTDPNTLSSGLTYFYRVSATNDFGASAKSNVASATTAAAPTAPSNLVATPSTGSLQINLAWSDNSGNESGFIDRELPRWFNQLDASRRPRRQRDHLLRFHRTDCGHHLLLSRPRHQLVRRLRQLQPRQRHHRHQTGRAQHARRDGVNQQSPDQPHLDRQLKQRNRLHRRAFARWLDQLDTSRRPRRQRHEFQRLHRPIRRHDLLLSRQRHQRRRLIGHLQRRIGDHRFNARGADQSHRHFRLGHAADQPHLDRQRQQRNRLHHRALAQRREHVEPRRHARCQCDQLQRHHRPVRRGHLLLSHPRHQ